MLSSSQTAQSMLFHAIEKRCLTTMPSHILIGRGTTDKVTPWNRGQSASFHSLAKCRDEKILTSTLSANGHHIENSHAMTTVSSLSESGTSGDRRLFSSTNETPTLEGYYHIEASNAIPNDGSIVYATRLTVTGPDVDGILASMTVALAMKGCSLVSLHAAKSQDMGYREHAAVGSKEDDAAPTLDEEESTMIKDIFYVVDRLTGQPFLDDELYDLAESLLDALKTPMSIMGGGLGGIGSKNYDSTTDTNTMDRVFSQQPTPPYPTRKEQITIISSDGSIL